MEISQLVDRCKKGDSEALGMLYTTYAKSLTKVCRRYLSDKQAVSDVLHDSFVVIITSLEQLRDNNKVEKWMKTITKNVALQYINYPKTHRIVVVEDTEESELFSDESQQVEIALSMTELMNFVDKLPEGCAQIFRLSVFDGLTHSEIAEKLGIEPHSSSSQLARAKMLLRKMIRQYWAVFLLLLIPISLFLLKKEDSVLNEDTQVVVSQNETQNIQPTEPKHTPLIVEQTKRQSIVCATDTIRKINKQRNEVVVSDTMTTTDHAIIAPDTLYDEQSHDTVQCIQEIEMPYYDRGNILPEKHIAHIDNTQHWSLGFAYAGGFAGQTISNIQTNFIGEYNYMQPNKDSDTIVHTKYHYMPITVALLVHYKQSGRLGLETGVSYIRMSSECNIEINETKLYDNLQTIHYIGIPLKGTYTLCKAKNWNLYGNLGFTMGIPIHSQYNTNLSKNAFNSDTYFPLDAQLHQESTQMQLNNTSHSKVPWLWSVGCGLGLQYNVTRNIGLFAEPSVQYYIPRNNNVETYCTEHPFSFVLPLGIKIIW